MSLSKLFNPKSIAVIGASTDPGSVGHIILQNLVEQHFPGKIYPVNPKTNELLGLTCYPNVTSIHEAVDMALIVVPAKIVPQVLQDVAAHKITAAIIISAGFKEAGVNGKVLEQQVKDIARQNNITLLGPNCLGFLHSSRSLNASFAKNLSQPGGITFFSQSGALCTTLLDETLHSLGYSHFVSVGNKALLKEPALLEYFIEDPETKLIAFYTEDLENAQALIDLGKKALLHNPPKPIIALKSGTTDAGSQASSSHTGAVAGSDLAYSSLFHQARITRAKSMAHLTELLEVFSRNPLPSGNRVAIVTNAGGMGVLATDCVMQSGLQLATLSEDTTSRLTLALPPAAGIHNPIDVLGDAKSDRYEVALDAALKDEGVDSILVIVTPQAMTESNKTAEAIIKAKEKTQKPIVTVFTDGLTLKTGRELLQKNNVSVLTHAENAARALGNLTVTAHWKELLTTTKEGSAEANKKRTEKAHRILSHALQNKEGYLDESSTRQLLSLYGFQFPKTSFVRNEKEALAESEDFNGKVVLKIVSPDITHKSDVGGVLTNILPKDIQNGYQTIIKNVTQAVPNARIDGILIAEQITYQPLELILGAKKEGLLGTMIVAGLGGIYVEVFKDVAARFSPLSLLDAREMLEELKAYPVLTGTRGQEGLPLRVLEQQILALGELIADCPKILELDINPLVYSEEKGFLCLDARIKIEL